MKKRDLKRLNQDHNSWNVTTHTSILVTYRVFSEVMSQSGALSKLSEPRLSSAGESNQFSASVKIRKHAVNRAVPQHLLLLCEDKETKTKQKLIQSSAKRKTSTEDRLPVLSHIGKLCLSPVFAELKMKKFTGRPRMTHRETADCRLPSASLLRVLRIV